MKKQILVLLVLILCTMLTEAQVYKRDGGIRMGVTSGFEFRSVRDDELALDVLLGFREHGFQVYGLLEKIKPSLKEKHSNLSLYYGPGIHMGYIRENEEEFYGYPEDSPYDEDRAFFVFGVDAVIGIQYLLPQSPLSVGADFKPFFEVQGFQKVKLNLWDFAFQLRYGF